MNFTPSIKLSKWIYNYCENNGVADLSNIKMQKLLYYCSGIASSFDLCDVGEVYFEAWKYGPVNRECYEEYKEFGPGKIWIAHSEVKYNCHTEAILSAVMKIYSTYQPFQLVEQTHVEEPWKEAWEKGITNIDSSKIKRYFSNHYKENEARPPSTFFNDAFFSIDGIPVKRFKNIFDVAEYVSEHV